MTKRVLWSVGYIAYGALAGWFLPLPLALLMIALPFAAWHAYRFYVWPRRLHRLMHERVDPAAGPPDGAEHVESDWPRMLSDLCRARHWEAIQSLLDDDFAVVYVNGVRHDRAQYLASLQRSAGEFHEGERAMLAHAAEPAVLWVRTNTRVVPRYGRDWDYTEWTRYTFAPEGRRLRELAHVGVTAVT